MLAQDEETGERMRKQIQKIKALTKGPFEVNITVGVGPAIEFSKKIVENE